MNKEDLMNLIPETYIKKVKKLKKLEREIKDLESTFKDNLKYEMNNSEIDELKIDGVKLKYINTYTTTVFDKNTFAIEHPRLYKDFLTTKQISDAIKITLL